MAWGRRAALAWLVLLAACAGSTGRRGEDVETFVARHWRQPLAPQGPAPAGLSALEASLAPEACGSCHPVQLADWRTSLHAAAMGPGVAGQLAELLERDPDTALDCHGCHAPLAEQAPLARTPGGLQPNPAFDAALRARGVACAACHVRGHERFGPPRREGSVADTAPRAGLAHRGATRTPAFLRSEFCRGCHQFGPGGFALNGKPLEDTYAEWKASGFARDGVQCQDCHMPDRRHLWRGVHDPEMVRAAVSVALETADAGEPGAVAAVLRLTSRGVGHAFPTYVTPAVVLRAEAVDGAGRVLPGTRAETVIARQVELDLSRELADTRLAPGQTAQLVYRRRLPPGARARFSVVVHPDAFYTAFFEALLRQGAGRGEAQVREALAAARRSSFVLFSREVPAGPLTSPRRRRRPAGPSRPGSRRRRRR